MGACCGKAHTHEDAASIDEKPTEVKPNGNSDVGAVAQAHDHHAPPLGSTTTAGNGTADAIAANSAQRLANGQNEQQRNGMHAAGAPIALIDRASALPADASRCANEVHSLKPIEVAAAPDAAVHAAPTSNVSEANLHTAPDAKPPISKDADGVAAAPAVSASKPALTVRSWTAHLALNYEFPIATADDDEPAQAGLSTATDAHTPACGNETLEDEANASSTAVNAMPGCTSAAETSSEAATTAAAAAAATNACQEASITPADGGGMAAGNSSGDLPQKTVLAKLAVPGSASTDGAPEPTDAVSSAEAATEAAEAAEAAEVAAATQSLPAENAQGAAAAADTAAAAATTATAAAAAAATPPQSSDAGLQSPEPSQASSARGSFRKRSTGRRGSRHTSAPASAEGLGASEVRVDALTEEPWAQIRHARKVYTDAGGYLDEYGDMMMLRFLVNNKWKPQATAKQLKSTAAWRKKVGADDIRRAVANGLSLLEMPKILETVYTVSIIPQHRTTLKGDSLALLEVGSMVLDEFFETMNNKDYFTMNLHLMEHQTFHADKTSMARGSLVRFACLVDAEGITTKHISMRMLWRLKPCMPLADLYYPEFIGVAVVFNSQWILHQGWKLIKGLLSEEIQRRVVIVGKEDAHSTILRVADPENIPTCFGGNLTEVPDDIATAIGVTQGSELLSKVDVNRIFPGEQLGVYCRTALRFARQQQV